MQGFISMLGGRWIQGTFRLYIYFRCCKHVFSEKVPKRSDSNYLQFKGKTDYLIIN